MTRLALAVAVAAATAAAGRATGYPGTQPVRVLTVQGITIAGRPDAGDSVYVSNVRNYKLYSADETFADGKATFRLPPGTYWAAGSFYDPGNALRTVVLPQFTVTGNKTVAVDERTATSELQIITPRPSRIIASALSVTRPDALGNVAGVESVVTTGDKQYVNTTSARPTIGKLRTYVTAELTGPAGSRYLYGTGFDDLSGLIHPIRYTVRPATLATVRMNLFSDSAKAGDLLVAGNFAPAAGFLPAWTYTAVQVPGPATVYLTASPAMNWEPAYAQNGWLGYGQFGAYLSYRPGSVVTQDWGAYPLHPAPNVNLPGAPSGLQDVVSAGRSGNTLYLNYTPFSDSAPGHTGTGFWPDPVNPGKITGNYRITVNGKTIQSGSAVPNPTGMTGMGFTGKATLPAAASVIGFTLNTARAAATLSIASSTTWTWHSAFAGRHILPDPWYCSYTLTSQDCVVQPLLTLRYTVQDLAMNGRTKPGRQSLQVTVGHLQAGTAPAIRTVTVMASFDNGKTWRSATVTGKNGSYRAAFSAPAHAFITLRTTATDTAGGTITETITRAYATA